MLVYRIEHGTLVNDNPDLAKHYLGPFRNMDGMCGANEYIDASNKSWFHFNSIPTPSEEGLPFEPWMLCACVSLEQLREWFFCPLGLEAMARLGFVIRSYDVPEIAVNRGGYQCTFPHDAAREVDVLPVTALAAA